MMHMIWPLLVVISANTLYHICAKATPLSAQPFASLTVTYLVAAVLSALLFFATAKDRNPITAVSGLNWTSVVLGCAVIGLEFGSLYLYRVGWKVSVGSLVSNVGLACVLLAVGVLLYREQLSPHQIFGFLLCLGGIALIGK